MKNYYRLAIFIAATLFIGAILSYFLPEYLIHIKSTLISFKRFCREHPVSSYLIYAGFFCLILSLGLPFTSAAMLLAGITYKFWEATLLVSVCRIAVAIIVFSVARHMYKNPQKYQKKPKMVKRFNQHPALGLFLMRISPIPDNAVNYSMGVSSINSKKYVLVSMLTMISSAIIWVSIGSALGSISALLRHLN